MTKSGYFALCLLLLSFCGNTRATDSRCEGKYMFEACDYDSVCVCPSLFIQNYIRNNGDFPKSCDNGNLVCRRWYCWGYWDSNVPMPPLHGAHPIACSDPSMCQLGNGKQGICTWEGYCCIDTPIWP